METKYVGLKVITASIAGDCGCDELPADCGCSRCGQEGYDVTYPDGYKSWSPKETFEKAYKSDGHFNFSHALELAKQGESFRLPQWEPDVRIIVQRPTELSKMTAPYLYVESRFGKVPWIPTQIEMFAENYELYCAEPKNLASVNTFNTEFIYTATAADKGFWEDVAIAVKQEYILIKDGSGNTYNLLELEGLNHAN